MPSGNFNPAWFIALPAANKDIYVVMFVIPRNIC
jgi:hypothetical protein